MVQVPPKAAGVGCVLASLCLPLFAEYPAVPAPSTAVASWFGVNMQKSMQRLTSGQSFKLVYFGQSLTDAGQSWTVALVDTLKKRFPKAAITMVNKSVAACASDCLGPKAQGQLAGTNPDLVIFQDYAVSPASYETLLKNMIAAVPNSEILVWSDHIHSDYAGAKDWFDLWDGKLLPELCRKHKLAYSDVFNMWKQYLNANMGGLSNYRQLTVDGVHMNAHGQWLLCQLVKQSFVLKDVHSSARLSAPASPRTAIRIADGTLQYTVPEGVAAGIDVFGADGRTVMSLRNAKRVGSVPLAAAGRGVRVVRVRGPQGTANASAVAIPR